MKSHGFRYRPWFGFLFAAICLLFVPSHVAVYAFETSELLTVSIIDVGQGDSILVEFPDGETMLVDAGTANEGDNVVDYLRDRHVGDIDILVATHPHEDHIGGMMDVLDVFTVGKVWDSGFNLGSATQERFLQDIQNRGLRFGTPRAGFTQEVGDVLIEVLAPPETLLSGTDSDANNNCIVMRLSFGDVSFLLAADMQAEERATVADWPECTILKVAHHGASNGTSPEFLREVSPEVAVISYGTGNSYGHPHQETRDALNAIGCAVKSTASNGTVIIVTDGHTYEITTANQAQQSGAGQSGTSASSGSGSGSGGSGNYIGNRNSHVFHRPTCSHLPYPQNRVYFDTREDAIAAGYRPCRICNP